MTVAADIDKPKLKAEVITWIQHIMDRKKWTGTDVARKAGLAPSTVLRLMNNPEHDFVPTFATLKKIADTSGYPVPRKVMEIVGEANIEKYDESPRPEPMNPRMFQTSGNHQIPMRGRVRLRHVSSLPESLQQKREDVMVPGAPILDGDDTAFAFHLPDNSLEPWLKAGTLAYATKRRDPIEGDWILITQQSGRSQMRLVKAISEKGVTLHASTDGKGKDLQKQETIKFEDLKDIAVVASVNLM